MQIEPKIDSIIKELSAELKSKYPDYEGLYLFGSRARGNSNEESDYDFALAFNHDINWQFKKEIISFVAMYDIKYQILIDVHVYKLNDILNPITPFRQNVFREGIYYAG
jgi:predicted nucleotidyltransferase